MDSIEKTGATVEAAIQAGLAELGVEPYQVMVEVIEEPDQGIMGHGARPARVRLVLMNGPMATRVAEPAYADDDDSTADATDARQTRQDTPHGRYNDSGADDYDIGQGSDDRGYDENDDEIGSVPPPGEVPDEEADELALVSRGVLNELLTRMQVEGHITIHRAENNGAGRGKGSKHDDEAHWVLNISGKRINRLIGRRGETLSSLQYIVRLIVSRRMQTRANVIVDAAQYKSRRSDRLEQLARRMANQAIQQGRTVTLEPMPAHERRIVHMTLRERKDIITKSVGDGDERKVTITPAE
jgi:spoIIIJ-associated protein